MPSYYTVLQYVPDPVIDERVNIGVIVVDDARLRCQFVSNWQRVRAFGEENIAFLRKFVKQIEQDCDPQQPRDESLKRPNLDAERLRQMAGKWMNSIQFTELRASLLDADALLKDVSQRFLRIPQGEHHHVRDRRSAVRLAASRIKEALHQKFGSHADQLLRRNYVVNGSLEKHQFDFGVTNGRPVVAGYALSFEVPETNELKKAVDAVKWAIGDVKGQSPELRMVVFALPPKGPSEIYDQAAGVFQRLATAFVPEQEFDTWSQRIAGWA